MEKQKYQRLKIDGASSQGIPRACEKRMQQALLNNAFRACLQADVNDTIVRDLERALVISHLDEIRKCQDILTSIIAIVPREYEELLYQTTDFLRKMEHFGTSS